MPIYEFRCNACRRRTSVFTRSMGVPAAAVCQNCGAHDLSRLFSRVAVLRGDGDESGGFDESSLADVDDSDPRSIAKWVRRMSREMGEPLEPQMEGELERLEAGESLDDLGDGDSEEEFGDVE